MKQIFITIFATAVLLLGMTGCKSDDDSSTIDIDARKFITSVIDGDNLPSIALRFKGESDFHVIHDRMSPTDRQNYEALLKSFDEPFTAVNALLKVIQDKGVELKATNL